MKTVVNVVCILGIVAVLAMEYVPDIEIDIPINGGRSAVEAAFSDSLSADLLEIANEVGVKNLAEIDKAIENAFQRAADEADRELDKSIQSLADDDYEGLKDALRKTAEELK
jgi:hypothetical protein